MGRIICPHCGEAIQLVAVKDAPRPMNGHARRDLLSPREREILALIADGETSACIARRLGVTMSAVHVHAANIRAALGSATTEGAVATAIRQGIL
jgi:DNA-binding NarL/FixJ family response regulator